MAEWIFSTLDSADFLASRYLSKMWQAQSINNLVPIFRQHFFRHLGKQQKTGISFAGNFGGLLVGKTLENVETFAKILTFDINQSSNRCRDELERPGALARCLSLTASRGSSIPLGLSAPGTFIRWFQSQHLVEENSHQDGDLGFWKMGAIKPNMLLFFDFRNLVNFSFFFFFCDFDFPENNMIHNSKWGKKSLFSDMIHNSIPLNLFT